MNRGTLLASLTVALVLAGCVGPVVTAAEDGGHDAGVDFADGGDAGHPTVARCDSGTLAPGLHAIDAGFSARNGLYPTWLAPLGSTLFFAGVEHGAGVQLWSSDGTPEGTHCVTNVGGGGV